MAEVKTILTKDLREYINNANGIVSLVGDHGAHVLITGEVSSSYAMRGMQLIETEVGTIYMDNDIEIQVIEAD